MNKLIDISSFNSLDLPKKLDFLANDFIESIKESDTGNLNSLLKSIVLNSSENVYIRKVALELFTELVILGKIKIRHAYNLLIDDWITSKDTHLELQRIKDLLLFYNPFSEECDDIQSIFISSSKNSEAEIIGESFYNLGIISLTEAFRATNDKEYKINLEEGKKYFNESIGIIENRIDSAFNQKVILILKEILLNNWDSANIYISELACNLFQREVFSFNYSFDNLQFGLYKILTSLKQICIQKPKDWIDYRLELDNLFLNYTEVTNSKIVTRLNEKELLKKIGDHLKHNVIEPFFVLNLTSEITKIDILLKNYNVGSEEWSFLQYLKETIQDSDKKKVENEYIKKGFQKLFPNYNPQRIEDIISKQNEPIDLLRIFLELVKRNNSSLLDILMFSSSKLQGDKKYWGNSVNENDRNRYLAAMVEAAGYTVKDQPQWSRSHSGKDSGEIDIFITEPNGMPKSIIEALVLDSLKQDYLILHLDKLFKYDITGLENNYIVVYSLAKNFNRLWVRYQSFISKHIYEYKFINFKELEKYRFADIKVGVANHMRNDRKVNLYHIMINLVER